MARDERARVAVTAFLGLAALAGLAAGQVITDFTIPTPNSQPQGIVGGPDGNLWICEVNGNKIARLTTDGVFTEFPIPTPASGTETITVGPDGNLWFAEEDVDKIGRITPDGTITEFPIPTSSSQPDGIVTGPDGNIWFAETGASRVGKITPDGVITEYLVLTADASPGGAAGGADGNVWFVEFNAGNVGRVTKTGVVTEFPIPTPNSDPYYISAGQDGNLWFSEGGSRREDRPVHAGGRDHGVLERTDGNGRFPRSRRGRQRLVHRVLQRDGRSHHAGRDHHGVSARGRLHPLRHRRRIRRRRMVRRAVSQQGRPDHDRPRRFRRGWTWTRAASRARRRTHNGILEAGETVQVAPHWTNTLVTAQALTGAASNLTGPAGPTYTINDSSADYGTVAAQSSADCNGATGDCYLMTVSGARPAAHWDATFTETIAPARSPGRGPCTWAGASPTCPRRTSSTRKIENLFHNGITGGCAGGGYCPDSSVTRAQMAVFLMKSKRGATNLPPAATGTVFADVPVSNPFAPAIEQLAGYQITGGCGGGNYCPNNPVTRAQMAVFLLKAEHGSAYTPPTCTGVFGDVACPSQFADWIEQLRGRGNHRRVRRRRLLSQQPEHPRTDGGVPGQDVRAPALRVEAAAHALIQGT